MPQSPELGDSIIADGIRTNYHGAGGGRAVVLVHGAGPGVSAWANWRLVIPALASNFRVLAPDMVGFGYTERPKEVTYNLDTWRRHLVGFLDALELDAVSIVGASWGAGLALDLLVSHPDRVERAVLIGGGGVSFPITPALDDAWGYQPSVENMKRLLETFAYDRTLVNDELVELRYQASVREGVQESFERMFPPPRQHCVDALAVPEHSVRSVEHEVLIMHGRDDAVQPLETSLRLFQLIDRSQLHVFGRAGHWIHLNHTSRFNRLLTDFLVEQMEVA